MNQSKFSSKLSDCANPRGGWRLGIGFRIGLQRFAFVASHLILLIISTTVYAQKTSSRASLIRESKAKFKIAVADAEAGLQQDKHKKEGVLVYSVRSKDGEMEIAHTRLYRTTSSGNSGYRGGRVSEYETVTIYDRHNESFELRINAPGYHEFIRSVNFRKGKVISWNDIILEPVTSKTSGVIEGTVHLEGMSNLGGIRVTVKGYPPVTTNRSGQFQVKGVGAGNQDVSASKQGYYGQHQSVLVSKGETVACHLYGFRRRSVEVRWSYQPNESRDLVSKVASGVSVLSPRGLDRVSFTSGFLQVGANSDFSIRQDKDKVILRNFDQRYQGPGIIQLHGISFDRVTEAPKAVYPASQKAMHKGDVFVLRTYDGKHYAKMEVLQIIDGLSAGQTESLSLTSICKFPSPLPSDGPRASIAVLDLDAGDNVSNDIVQAVSDLVRNVIQDTGRYLVVERDSIIEILGEEDFMSTVKCDDTRCLVNYGKKLRAQKILHGRVSLVGNNYIVSLKLLDVSSAKVDALNTNRTSESVDSLLDLIEPQTCELIRSTFP